MKGKQIDKGIVSYLTKQEMASTREIAQAIDVAWHSANTHCLKLQISGVVEGLKLGNMNVWRLSDE